MPLHTPSTFRDRAIGGLPLPFVLALAGLGIVLTISVIPAPFTVDDNNYLINVLALREGRVTVANTDGQCGQRCGAIRRLHGLSWPGR